MMKKGFLKVLFATTFGMLLMAQSVFASEGHGGEEQSTLLGVPLFVWFTIVNFIIFVAVLVVVLRKPLMNFLRGRKESIAKEMEDAQKLLENAQKHHAEITARLDRLESELATVREQIRKEGEAEGERIMERARQAAERIRREADFQAEQEVKMAKMELREEAARLAVKLAEEALEKAISDADRERLINEFITEVARK
jgi:F-type H+-transporting ATPase subunit b